MNIYLSQTYTSPKDVKQNVPEKKVRKLPSAKSNDSVSILLSISCVYIHVLNVNGYEVYDKCETFFGTNSKTFILCL